MQRTELAAGRDHITLDETEPRIITADVGAASDKTEFSEAAASVGARSTPAPLDRSYVNVRESVVYEEVL